MPSLRDLFPTRLELPAAHRPLMAFAAIVALSLLAFYVHLLHESMALGEQMRERQRPGAGRDGRSSYRPAAMRLMGAAPLAF